LAYNATRTTTITPPTNHPHRPLPCIMDIPS
jgi:hypothetical protein